MHIHITGASGSGTTTLGLALAELLGIRHLDTDQLGQRQAKREIGRAHV